MTEETREYVLRDGPSLMDVLRQAEADRDAYAAVAKAAIKWLWTDSDNDAHLLDVALDALTPEQKERIT